MGSRYRAAAFLAAALAVTAATLHAQGFWVKKDWRQWSGRECKKLLEDSPWTQSRRIGAAMIREAGRGAEVEGRVSEPEVIYLAQLWSALPVRQAAVRRVQLQPAFSKLSEDDRKALEDRHARVLAADFRETIVLKILYSTNVPQYLQDLSRYWRNRPADLWQQDTFLVTAAGRFPPRETRIAPEGGEIQLLFPRVVDGQPIIRPGDKSFSLELGHPTIGPLREQRVLLEFKVSEMTVGPQVEY